MNIPKQITAGDSATWVDSPAGAVTSAEWSLVYTFRGESALTLASVASGNGWATAITTAQSSTLVAGEYFWQASATKGNERVTLGSGVILVAANLAYTVNPAAFDGRTQAQKDLEAVRAAMRSIVTGGATQEYSIGNRSLKKMAMADLIALEDKLKADVAREARADRLAKGMNSGRAVYVRF